MLPMVSRHTQKMNPAIGGNRIKDALGAAGFTQGDLAQASGISRPTLTRIISGDRAPKMPEVAAIAWATGATVTELMESERLFERVRITACASRPPMMGAHKELLSFLQLDTYLEDQAILSMP